MPKEHDQSEMLNEDYSNYCDNLDTLQLAKEEIAGIFINLSFGNKLQVKTLQQCGVIDTIKGQLHQSNSVKIIASCIQALANFIAEDFKIRDELIEDGLLEWL